LTSGIAALKFAFFSLCYRLRFTTLAHEKTIICVITYLFQKVVGRAVPVIYLKNDAYNFMLKNDPNARRRGASGGAYFFRYVSSAATKATQQMGAFQRVIDSLSIISFVIVARSYSGIQPHSLRAALSSILCGHESAMACLIGSIL